MKKIILFLLFIVWCNIQTFAQTVTISIPNGDFNNGNTGWVFDKVGTLRIDSNSCGQSSSNKYVWSGSTDGKTGYSNMADTLLSPFFMCPQATTACTLFLKASISTSEMLTVGDYVFFDILDASGTVLKKDLGYLGVLQAQPGYNNGSCAPWSSYYLVIPYGYVNQNKNVRIRMRFISNASGNTVFRMDDFYVTATMTCNYTIGPSSFTCPNSNFAVYNNISTVTVQGGCQWQATVTQGASWLSTNSVGSGTGNVSITVADNLTSSLRTGTIDVAGKTITITQPPLSVGITKINMNPVINIFPNPATDNLIIEIAQHEHKYVFYNIFGISGDIVEADELHIGTNNINISKFPAGIYMVVISDSNSNILKEMKLVKRNKYFIW
jgi:hypothetical protein